MTITVPCIICKRDVKVDWKPEDSIVAPSYGIHPGCGDTTSAVPKGITTTFTNFGQIAPEEPTSKERK